MSNSSINVTVKLFAAYQEVYGISELKLSFSQTITVGEVLDYLIKDKPKLAKLRDVTRFGVNLQFVAADTVIYEGDEIVFIPPVSGG